MSFRLAHLVDALAALAGRLLFRRVPLLARQQCRSPRSSRPRRPVRCWFERLEAREVFNATYHGGALLPHVEAQAVFLGSQWTSNSTLITEAAAMDNMLAYTVQSPYMDLLTDNSFNVGQGTATTGARVSVSLTATSTDATIRSLLQQSITLKLVQQPTLNRLYVVYMPSGITVNNNGATSQTTFLGYHGAFAGRDASNIPFDIHYVVVPHPGAPNPTSTTNGFTGAAEVQTLTLGGLTATGSLTPAFNGAFATTSIFRTNEVQKLTLSGASDTIHLLFNGVSGSDATQLSFVAGTSPTATDVQTHLNTIPALNGNVTVTGNNGGPFTISFGGALANVDSSTLTTSVAGSATANVTSISNGHIPTAADVLASLNSIPSTIVNGATVQLNGNVTVTGNAGGPFTITIRNLGNIPPIDVSGVTGGVTASITTTTDGFAGITSDLDQLTSVTAHELAEAVTDPDINYKTLGWYDDPNNVEIADLSNPASDIPLINVRLGPSGYFVQDVFSQSHQTIAADTTSIPLLTGGMAVGLTGVTVTPISATQALVSWNPVDKGASGYRVFLMNGSQATLLSRVPRTATSTVVTLPALQSVTLKVEAYNAAHTASFQPPAFTLTPPALQKPIATATKLTSTSARVSWNNSIASGSPEVLTLGGTSEGKFTLAYNGVQAAQLTRTDEVQTLTLGGTDGGTVVLTYKGVTGSTATQLKFIAGASPTATDVLNHLSSIPELSLPGSVQVTGIPGGPFTIKFTGGLSGQNIDQVTATASGGATAVVATTVEGAVPTAADVQANLNAIPALTGHVTVAGNAGGPYFITINTANPALLTVAAVEAGVTASVNAPSGASGYRIFRVISGKKTLVASLPGTASSATITGLPANANVSFIVEAFRGSQVADSTAVSVALGKLAAPGNFTVTNVNGNPNVFKLTWDTVADARGYRVYRQTSTGRRVLVSTLGKTATMLTISGLPAGTKFQVEAFSSSQTARTAWMTA